VSVEAAFTEALGHLLLDRHVGREHAAKSPVLLQELEAAGFPTRRVRSIGEAVDELLDQLAICSTSGEGYWVATTAEDIEASLAEVEKRARMSLRRRRRLRQRLMEFRGQVRSEVA
jgi:predicted secreted protein